MSKRRYSQIIVFLIILGQATCVFAAARDGSVDVGRNNPFAKINITKKSAPQVILRTGETSDEVLGLFLETIPVKFCDAKSLKSVVDKMVSEYGSVSVDEKTNSLIVCDSEENLEKILVQIKRAEETASPPEAAANVQQKPEMFIESITLKFLNARSVKPVIDRMVSEYGSVSIDEKTNSVLISDTKKKTEAILAELSKVDKTPPQIMVEVVILDVKLENDTEIGINWDLLSTKNYDYNYRQNFTASRVGATASSDTTTGNATAFNSTGLGGDFAVISGTVRNVVHLIQEKRDAEILASPRVMMVSGQSAMIEAVEELPYTELTGTAEGGAQALTSTQFKLVGVKLDVAATLIDSNNIFLTVQAEQNVAVGESTTQVPIVDTRRAQSSLMLREGQVVVFGGLRRQDKVKTTNQIPILGDLPVIGWLFKSTDTVVNNSELIVFLSPHIYNQEPVKAEEMAKYDQITKRPLLALPDGESKSTPEKSDK